MAADRLDVRHLDGTLVEQRSTGLAHGSYEVGVGDRSEELAALPGTRRDDDGETLELILDLLGVGRVADLPGIAGALDLRDLLLATRGPRHGQATRDEEVAAVAVLDGDDITGDAEAIDGLGEDDLHLYLAELV